MEIIKEPNMQTTCQKCGCEFKVDKDDVSKRGGSGRKHTPRQYLGVYCPVCKSTVEVWSKES